MTTPPAAIDSRVLSNPTASVATSVHPCLKGRSCFNAMFEFVRASLLSQRTAVPTLVGMGGGCLLSWYSVGDARALWEVLLSLEGSLPPGVLWPYWVGAVLVTAFVALLPLLGSVMGLAMGMVRNGPRFEKDLQNGVEVLVNRKLRARALRHSEAQAATLNEGLPAACLSSPRARF